MVRESATRRPRRSRRGSRCCCATANSRRTITRHAVLRMLHYRRTPLRRSITPSSCNHPGARATRSRPPEHPRREQGGSMKLRHPLLCAALTAALLATGITRADDEQRGPLMVFRNASGLAATYNTTGPLDLRNPFFQKLGTNGRSCETCHQASDGWTVTPEHVRARFDATKGLDPIFRINDGANSPDADVSTVQARQAAYSMLLTK